MSTTVETPTEILPFHVDISQDKLADLHQRIAATRWPHKELVADRSQGVQLATLQKLARYWATEHDWRKTEAAWTLWRATGDASTAAGALTSVIQPLSTGSYLPVHLAAMRYLAAITETSGQATGIARAVLANPRRLASSGGWRTFDQDDQIRAAAAAYLTSRTTGQPG